MPLPTPNQLVLDVRAQYFEDGDTVLATVFVVDPDQELGFPGYVSEGTCVLLYRSEPLFTVDFDRRFGNGGEAEGDFIFQFIHPPVQTDMRIQVDLVIDPVPGNIGVTLQRNVPVTHAEKPFIPLSEQIDSGADANNEFRSKKRLEEEL